MGNLHRKALRAIYGDVPDETWEMVVRGEVTPPRPLPEVLRQQGLRLPR
jgi:hypothetical protein